MRVMVTGAGGMLADAVGAHLKQSGDEPFGIFYLDEDVSAFKQHFPNAELLKLGDYRKTREWLDRLLAAAKRFRPDWIFHFAAWTDVDGCEVDEDRAYRSNAIACFEAARAAREVSARLLTISTDYVFDGAQRRPYREDDRPNPLSVYGRTKHYGERLVQKTGVEHVIVRTAWLHGPFGKNFVRTIAQRLIAGMPVRVVNDQRGCPTYTQDLALAIRLLALSDARGVYHVANTGDASWYELALAIGEALGKSYLVDSTSTRELGRPAPRPPYSVLDSSRFSSQTGVAMPNWLNGLQRHLSTSIAKDASGGYRWVGR